MESLGRTAMDDRASDISGGAGDDSGVGLDSKTQSVESRTRSDPGRTTSDGGGPRSDKASRPTQPGSKPSSPHPTHSPQPRGGGKAEAADARAAAVRREAVRSGMRRLRQQTQRNGEQLRNLRLRANVSQAAVARAIGVDRSVISRLEAGDPSVGLATRFVAGELLGAEIALSTFSVDSPRIYDRAHARLVERLVRAAHEQWQIQPEAPVPGPGRRSVDLRIDGPEDIVLCEVESKLHRVEEIVRECTSKANDIAATANGRRVHVVLVLPPTRHNRAVVEAARETLRHVFPHGSPELLAALTGGGPWPGSGILWLGVDDRTKRTAAEPTDQRRTAAAPTKRGRTAERPATPRSQRPATASPRANSRPQTREPS